MDVGAHTGFYAFGLCKKFKQVYAYEPFGRSARMMVEWASKKKINNVTVRQIALSNRVGKLRFFLSRRGPKCHSSLPLGRNSVMVPCSTLSAEFPDTKIDLVKVDVEGAEMEVLLGARNIMRNIRSWVIEIHDKEELLSHGSRRNKVERKRFAEEIKSYLESFGYKTKWVIKGSYTFLYADRR